MVELPQPGGQQRSQTKFIIFENFEKMNTQSARQSLSEKELAWLENLQLIAPNNLVTVPAAAAAALATITENISTMFYDALGGVDYFVAFTTAGSGYLINIATGNVNHFAIAGTFSSQPDVTTWQANRLLIADSKAGYATFDGALFVGQGGVSPNITVTAGGSGYSSPPPVTFVYAGSGGGAAATSVIQNGSVIAVNLTNPGSGFSAATIVGVQFGTGVGSGATGHVTMTGVPVAAITLKQSAFYDPNLRPPGNYSLTFSGAGGAAGFATLVHAGGQPGADTIVQSVTLTAAGAHYMVTPACTLSLPPSNGSTVINVFMGTGSVAAIILDTGGSGYVAPPTVTIAGTAAVAATAHATEAGGAVTSLILNTPGSGYTVGEVAVVIIGTGSGAAAIAHVWPFINSSIAANAFTTLAVFQGRVWLAGGNLLTWTGTGASYGNVGYDDFLIADASGSLIISDADLIHAITALRSLNNYLFIMGDQSVKQIGNISLDSTGLITLFTILTLSSDQGTIYPKSCISYNRVFLFANTNGIYGVFGSSVQKLSGDLDGIFELVDFSQVPQGAILDLNAIHNAVFLVRYKDPVAGTRSILVTFDGKRWYVTSQSSTLTAIATSASFATGAWSLYGSSGPDVTQLFAAPTTPVNFKIQTSLTHHGNALQGKKVIRAGYTGNLTTAESDLTMLVEADATANSYTMEVPTGFSLVGGSNDENNAAIGAAGIYLGLTLTGTLAGYTITNLIVEYQETSLWKGA